MFDREASNREIEEYHRKWSTSNLETLETELNRINITIDGERDNFESLDGMDTTGMSKEERSMLLIDKAHACLTVIEGLLHRVSLQCYINRNPE